MAKSRGSRAGAKNKRAKPTEAKRARAPKKRAGRGSNDGDAAPIARARTSSPEPSGTRGADGGGTAATGKYVYCIIRASEPLEFGHIGIGRGEPLVNTVHHRDVAAVVSNATTSVHDPTRENVLAHQHVNETVMRDHTVIPMAFGTVFKADKDIEEFLRSTYDAFSDVLTKMKDKLEFGLKVLWDSEAIVRELE